MIAPYYVQYPEAYCRTIQGGADGRAVGGGVGGDRGDLPARAAERARAAGRGAVPGGHDAHRRVRTADHRRLAHDRPRLPRHQPRCASPTRTPTPTPTPTPLPTTTPTPWPVRLSLPPPLSISTRLSYHSGAAEARARYSSSLTRIVAPYSSRPRKPTSHMRTLQNFSVLAFLSSPFTFAAGVTQRCLCRDSILVSPQLSLSN